MFSPITDRDYQEILRRLRAIHEGQLDISASAPKPEPPRPRYERGIWMPEDEGQLSLLAFCHRAGKKRIKTANPEYQSLPFDSIAIAKLPTGFKLSTVQVKGTSYQQNGIYQLDVRRTHHQTYLPGDFDFLAGLIVPLDLWYIIPFHSIPQGSSLHLHPHSKPRKGFQSCDRYLDRWDLLQ